MNDVFRIFRTLIGLLVLVFGTLCSENNKIIS